MGQKLITEFTDVLDSLKTPGFKEVIISILEKTPDYITNIPSSSTGKYHPKDEINSNGMILHIRRALALAPDILRMRKDEDSTWNRELDILLAACILHDSFKNGKKEKNNLPENKYTHPWHPIWIFYEISAVAGNLERGSVVREMTWTLAWVCLFHEGRWTIDKAKEVAKNAKMTEEVKQLCKDFHMIDYVVSRRGLFDAFANN